MPAVAHTERNAHDTAFPAGASPGPVPREAIAYWDGKQYTPRISFDYRDVWAEEHAVAFTVAKVTRHDVLAAIRMEIDRSIREGIPFEQFQRSLQPRLVELGWWGAQESVDPLTGESVTYQVTPRRLRTIFETNMRQARSAGQWDRIQRTKDSRPYLMYLLGPSLEHREEHVSWAGTILPVDHPFWLTHCPMCGWGCKCHLRSLTQREAERLGGITDVPDSSTEPYVNARTGETYHVPVGVDPGFETNAGVSRTNDALRAPIQQRTIAWAPGAQEDYQRLSVLPQSAEAEAFDQRWLAKWKSDSTDSRAGIGNLMVGSPRSYGADQVARVYQTGTEHVRDILQSGETIGQVAEAAIHRYARTQAALAEANVSVVSVWRGVNGSQVRQIADAIRNGAQRIRLAVRPLVSTSISRSDAVGFAEDWGGGYVVRMDAASARVFSHPLAEARLSDESEVILLTPEGWIDIDLDDVILVPSR